jgi:hypothetical protein
LSILGSAWLDSNCSSSNWCNCTDLDLSGGVNTPDIAMLAENWLTSVFNGMIVLGRPTNTSITANLLSNTALETYLEYGTLPGVYTSQTDVILFRQGLLLKQLFKISSRILNIIIECAFVSVAKLNLQKVPNIPSIPRDRRGPRSYLTFRLIPIYMTASATLIFIR